MLRIGNLAAGRQAGFTLFELIIVICVVAIMAGILLQRLQGYEEAAERVAMQQTAVAIKSALQMRVAGYLISGRDNEIDGLRTENPVNWLQEKPENYAGEFQADAYAQVPPGSWYFDRPQREMIYVVNRGDGFKPGPDGRKWVRYRVKVEYEEMPGSGVPARKILNAATFVPVEAFVWF